MLLMRRHERSNVLGGVYVFPGGKLDKDDQALASLARLDRDPQQLHAMLGEPDIKPEAAAGLFLAALRETQEEVGVLLADHGETAQPLWRTRDMLPWLRWITPLNPAVGTHRFDTRFFLAVMPAGQEARPDAQEATRVIWLTPRDTLQRYCAGAIELAPAQLMSLVQLARHPDVASVWAEAKQAKPRCIQPETFEEAGVCYMCYPGDPRHTKPGRAMPGPLRLRVEKRRVEPLNGDEGWFE